MQDIRRTEVDHANFKVTNPTFGVLRTQGPEGPSLPGEWWLPSEASCVMKPVSVEEALAALGKGSPVGGSDFQGLEFTGWVDETWILHPMFEEIDPSDARTRDEVRRSTPRPTLPDSPVRELIEEILDREGTVEMGLRSGLAQDPGGGWRRVRWKEFLERHDARLQGHEVPPCFRWFPFTSWPVALQSPCEGSMDMTTFKTFLDEVKRHSPDGEDSEAFFVFAGAYSPESTVRVMRGRLAEAWWILAEHAKTSAMVAPQNVWSIDGSWCSYTDIDLMATKVAGDRSLLASIRENEELETFDWKPPT